MLSLTQFIKEKAIAFDPSYKDPLKFDNLLNTILDDKQVFSTWNKLYNDYVQSYLKDHYPYPKPIQELKQTKPLRYLNRKEQ